jgi:hypothetical protein
VEAETLAHLNFLASHQPVAAAKRTRMHRAALLALEAHRNEAYANQVALRALLVGAPDLTGALATAGEVQVEVLQAETEGPDRLDSVMHMDPAGVEGLFAYRLARLLRVTGAWN